MLTIKVFSRENLVFLIVVLLLVIGVSLSLISNSVIAGYEQRLDASDLTLEEMWVYEGVLQWWRLSYATLFLPLSVILVTVGGLLFVVSVFWSIAWATIRPKKKLIKPSSVQASGVSPHSVSEIAGLEAELEKLRRQVWSYKRLPTRLAGYIVTFVGAAVLVSSMIFSSSVWAIVGLVLTFWGIFFFFLKPTSLVKADLLDSASYSLLENVHRLVSEFGLKGKGVYLPTRYLEDLSSGLVFIPAKDEVYVPTVDEVVEAEKRIFLKNPSGVFFVASGVALANLFERELGTSFAKVDLEYLMRNLPRVFVEALEISEDFDIGIEGGKVHVRIEGSVYKDLCEEFRRLSRVCGSFGCPLCSSIACALARTSGRPVVMDRNEFSRDGNVIDVYYRVLEE
jgi:hypothetical protein